MTIDQVVHILNLALVMSFWMTTRNLGAAFALLFAISSVDQRAIVMIALGVPMQTIISLLAARWLVRRTTASGPAAAQTPAIPREQYPASHPGGSTWDNLAPHPNCKTEGHKMKEAIK